MLCAPPHRRRHLAPAFSAWEENHDAQETAVPLTDTQLTTDRPAQTSRQEISPVWQRHGEPRSSNRPLPRPGPVITLAYDNGPVTAQASRRRAAGVSAIPLMLGLFFIAESFGPFLIGVELLSKPFAPGFFGAFHSLAEGALQTLILLQLVVGGNLVLFATGTEKGFFRPPCPPLPLLSAILVAQVATTLLCGAGWLVEPVPWQVIAWVWVYNLLWIIVLRGVWLAGGRLADFLRQRQREERGAVQSAFVATPAGDRTQRVRPYLIHNTQGADDQPG